MIQPFLVSSFLPSIAVFSNMAAILAVYIKIWLKAKNKILFFSHAILFLNIQQLLYYASQMPQWQKTHLPVQDHRRHGFSPWSGSPEVDTLKWEDPLKKDHREAGSQRKQRNSKQPSTSASLTTWKPLTVWNTTNCVKFLRIWEYQTTLPVSWEICMWVKKQQNWTTDWFKIGKGLRQGYVLSPCLFNFYTEYIMQNARLDELQAGIKIARGNITTSDMQMIPL